MQGGVAAPDERISSFYSLLDAWPGFLRKAAQEHTRTHGGHCVQSCLKFSLGASSRSINVLQWLARFHWSACLSCHCPIMTEADLSGYLYNTYNSSNRSATIETLPRPSCLPFFLVRINGQWALPFVSLLAGRNVLVEWRKVKSLQESCSAVIYFCFIVG